MYIIEVKNKLNKKAYPMITSSTNKLILGDKINPDTRTFASRQLALLFIEEYKRFLMQAKSVTVVSVAELVTRENISIEIEQPVYIVIQEDPRGNKSFISYDEILQSYSPNENRESACKFYEEDARTVIRLISKQMSKDYKYTMQEVKL